LSDLEAIRDYVLADARIGTAGQPTANELASIRDAGYELVINLAMPTSIGALAEEGEILEELGVPYAHIPVDWERPSPADVDAFFAVMDANRARRVFVHCALNMRASAFVYLYRRIREGVGEPVAAAAMRRVWEPYDQWADLVASTLARYGLSS
jgi:protein tyrosine phosphatase (PTP) superfamily phosphohydrolase (DUF442 family)